MNESATTIDKLSIEIETNSSKAADGIEELAIALGDLKNNGKISTAVKNIGNLADALKKLTPVTSNANKLSALANSVNELSKAGSFARVVNQLNKLPGALKGLSSLNIDNDLGAKLEKLAQATTPLSNIKTGGLGTMINALGKIGDVTAKLDDATIGKFADRVEKLSDKLTPLSTKMTTVQTGLRGINSSAKSAGDGVKHFGSKVNTTTLNLSSLITVVQGAISMLMPLVRLFSSTISEAIEWEGIAARFGRGFGDQAEEVYEWIQRLNKEMGINVQQFMQYSSVYATMLKGFGVAHEDAGKMALGYTELTYDIWAGYNDVYKNFADAAEAVKSAIAGEVEPVRRAGFTIVESQLEQTAAELKMEKEALVDMVNESLSAGEVEVWRSKGLIAELSAEQQQLNEMLSSTSVDSTLKQTAANHGLEISLENATEAEKSYLRYLTLVDQAHAQNLVGTYARELNTAEGYMRTFSQQLKSLAQAFGSLFLPILVKVMPWLSAFVNLLTKAIAAVAAFFGVEIQPVDWSGYNSGASSLEGVGDAADTATGSLGDTADAVDKTTDSLKDLKKATIGIDELNVISPPTQNSGSGSGGSGGIGGIGGGSGLDGLFDDIDSLWDDSIFDEIQWEVDKIEAMLKEALTSITAIIGGFMLAIGTILVVSGANIPLGLALMAAGAVTLVGVIAQNWNGMSEQLAKTLTIVTAVLGGFLLAIGAVLAFGGVNVPLGVALMAAGAISLATAATINWKFLNGDMKNALSIITGIVSGALLALGAMLLLTGVWPSVGIALLAAGAVGLAATVALNWDSIPTKLKKVIADITMIVSNAAIALGAILAFSTVNVPLGMALMAAGALGLVAVQQLNWDSTISQVKQVLNTLTQFVSSAMLGVGAVLAFSSANVPLGVALMAAGAVGLASNATINWNYIVDKVKTVLKEIGIAAGVSLIALGVLLLFCPATWAFGIGLIAAGAASLVTGVALNWNAIVDKVKEIVKKIGEAWDGLWSACIGGIKKMFDGVVGWFTDLWDTLVGHSIVPDTIDGIVKCFTSLPGRVLSTVSNFVKNIISKFSEFKVVQVAVSLVKKGWTTVKGWIGSIPGVSQAVSLVKSGWSSIKSWIGSTSVISQGIKLVKTGWSSVKKWVGSIPTLSQAIKLVKSGWSSVKRWIGSIPTLSQGIRLAKSGWSSVKSWIGKMPTLSAGIKLVKSGWTSVKKWLGNLNFNIGFKLPRIGVKWGTAGLGNFKISYPAGFYTYAKGGFPDLGELFIAREAGPEMVGKIGNKTTVANNQQIVEAVSEGVYAAVLAAMRQSESNGSQSVNVYLDGRQITSAVEKRQRERGANIVNNGVYAY